MKTSITLNEVSKLVDIDESVVFQLATLQSQNTDILVKKQLRSIILGDFLVTSAGINIAVAVNIVKHVTDVLDFDQSDFLDPSIQILDYKAVILVTNTSSTPLVICNSKGIKITELPDAPPILLLTVFLTHLFRKANV